MCVSVSDDKTHEPVIFKAIKNWGHPVPQRRSETITAQPGNKSSLCLRCGFVYLNTPKYQVCIVRGRGRAQSWWTCLMPVRWQHVRNKDAGSSTAAFVFQWRSPLWPARTGKPASRCWSWRRWRSWSRSTKPRRPKLRKTRKRRSRKRRTSRDKAEFWVWEWMWVCEWESKKWVSGLFVFVQFLPINSGKDNWVYSFFDIVHIFQRRESNNTKIQQFSQTGALQHVVFFNNLSIRTISK